MKVIVVLCGFLALWPGGCASSRQGRQGDEALGEAGQEVKVFPSVMGAVPSAVFSPDGLYVLTGDFSGSVKVWDRESSLVRSYYGHEGGVNSVSWSPDGKLIASGSTDGTIRIWDADFSSQAKELYILRGHTGCSVVFSPDSRLLVSGFADGTVRIWDLGNGREIKVLEGHEGILASVSFSPDGKYIVSASWDKKLIIWDAKTYKEIKTLTGHTGVVLSAAWSHDSKQIVSASEDKTVRIWDAETGESRVIGRNIFDDSVCDAKFSPDGKQIATADGFLYIRDKKIIIWDIETGSEIHSFNDHLNTVLSVEWDSEGKYILSASADNTAKIYDAQTRECIRTFAGETDIIRPAVLSSEGKYLVTGSEGKKLKIWNAETGVLEQNLEHLGAISAFAISPDGRLLAVGSNESNQIKLWEMETWKELPPLLGHLHGIFSLSFHPEGKYLASASNDTTIRIWDIEEGMEIDTLFGHEDTVYTLAFSTDGSFLVSGSYDKTVCIWESAGEGQYEKKDILEGHTDFVISVAISPDNGRIVSGSRNGEIGVWDLETGHGSLEKLGSVEIMSVQFSPDARSFIATSGNSIQKWEAGIDNEEQYKGGIRLPNVIYSLSYSPDGTRIIAGISDGTARIFNAGDLSEIASFISFTDGEWICVTPDGYYNSSANGDKHLNVLIGNTASSMDQYRDIFSRPDLLPLFLSKEGYAAETSIKNAALIRPPTVTIRSPANNSTEKTLTAKLNFSVDDRNHPIQTVKVLVNGRPVGGVEMSGKIKNVKTQNTSNTSFILTGKQKTVDFEMPVTLDPGRNVIDVLAFNGYSWSSKTQVSLISEGIPPEKMPDLWIAAIGVNIYINDKPLYYCARDAEEIVKTFKQQEGLQYRKVNSLLITDNNAEMLPTAANIKENLRFLSQAKPRDIVILFLAGHGGSDAEGNFVFLPRDAAFENGIPVASKTLSSKEILESLDIPCKRLAFIDACFSGGTAISNEENNKKLARALGESSAFILTSARSDELSEERWQEMHGVFTYYLLQGLSGKADGAKDTVTPLQLSSYVTREVRNLTDNKQNPVIKADYYEDFTLAQVIKGDGNK